MGDEGRAWITLVHKKECFRDMRLQLLLRIKIEIEKKFHIGCGLLGCWWLWFTCRCVIGLPSVGAWDKR